MISNADIERFIADDTTPRPAEARPRDWLDDVFDGSMLAPDTAVPSLVALWAAAVIAGTCFATLAGIVVWAVLR